MRVFWARFLLFAFLLLVGGAAQADEVIKDGLPCTVLGTSTMATDQTAIATCLRKVAGSSELVWRSSGASSGVPAGTIVLWSGVIATIPSGWALCNGANGTPDLRNRFVVGAGTDGGTYTAGTNDVGTGAYSPGAKGGEDQHVLTIAQMPSHTHSMNLRYNAGTGNYGSSPTISGGTLTTGAAGSGAAHENRPPYFALAYIMKL